MLTVPLLDAVQGYRLEQGRNLWSGPRGGLMNDLVFIMLEWY